VELTGLNKWAFTAFEYGEKWKTYRRLFHEFFNIANVDRYDEDQRKATGRLLKNLSEHPADFHHHIQLATGSLALSTAYGVQVDSSENPIFHAAEEATESLQAALVPGAFPVEFLPIRELHSATTYPT
jgi:cytochrome P450